MLFGISDLKAENLRNFLTFSTELIDRKPERHEYAGNMIPISPLLTAYLVVFLSGWLVDFLLTRLNTRHLKTHGRRIPGSFEGFIDHDKLSKITDYTVENQQFAIFSESIGSVCFVAALMSGILPRLFEVIQSLNLGNILSAMVFFAVLGMAQMSFSLPFNYYQTFVIEQRYGFNTCTRTIWIADILKGLIIGSIIGGILLGAILLLITYGGQLWWLCAWFVFFAFQLLLLIVYPTVIAPWFNTFLPLEDKGLEAKVKDIMLQGGLSVKGVFSMDAGKRSRHSNAYFTGLGTTKRIVLFDTLLASQTHEEVLAILAHEIGHWKKRHVLKNILLVGVFSIVVFYVSSILLTWTPLYETFGFGHPEPCVGIFLCAVFGDALSGFLVPMGNAISRHHEREADAFAAELLQDTKGLANALKGLAKDNLANLHPHPLYAWFYYSHPPLVERIRYLEAMGHRSRQK
jgi:STE24 endopeptidase